MHICGKRRHVAPTVLIGLLIIWTAVMGGPPAAADTTYTYTGAGFVESSGLDLFPDSPAIGTFVSVSFTTSGPLPIGDTYLTDFTMSCGDLHLNATDPSVVATLTWVSATRPDPSLRGYFPLPRGRAMVLLTIFWRPR